MQGFWIELHLLILTVKSSSEIDQSLGTHGDFAPSPKSKR